MNKLLLQMAFGSLILKRYKILISNPVYKQLALRRKIAEQLSGLNPPSLNNNKNCSLIKCRVLLCNKRKIAAKPTIHQNKALLRKF